MFVTSRLREKVAQTVVAESAFNDPTGAALPARDRQRQQHAADDPEHGADRDGPASGAIPLGDLGR